MTLIDKALSRVGLMREAEHEKITRLKTAALDTISQSYVGEMRASADWEAKFKKAVTDLEAAVVERDALQRLGNGLDGGLQSAVHDRSAWERSATEYAEALANARTEIASLRPDAQKWRDRAEREQRRGQNKRASASK